MSRNYRLAAFDELRALQRHDPEGAPGLPAAAAYHAARILDKLPEDIPSPEISPDGPVDPDDNTALAILLAWGSVSRRCRLTLSVGITSRLHLAWTIGEERGEGSFRHAGGSLPDDTLAALRRITA